MSRDWTKKELKAVSTAMKEEGYMSFGEFCKKGKFIYPEETQIENTANAANTTNTAAEVAPMKHLTFTVAECGEYHSVGRYRDDIATVEEAIDIYQSRQSTTSIGAMHRMGVETSCCISSCETT